jgi:hypothetical protein
MWTQRLSPWEEQEVEAARRAAAAIGGRAGDENLDPAQRPLLEAGEGEAEGFELAEADLIDAAEHGAGSIDPLRNAFTPESGDPPGARYSEADHEASSELPADDR